MTDLRRTAADLRLEELDLVLEILAAELIAANTARQEGGDHKALTEAVRYLAVRRWHLARGWG